MIDVDAQDFAMKGMDILRLRVPDVITFRYFQRPILHFADAMATPAFADSDIQLTIGSKGQRSSIGFMIHLVNLRNYAL